MMYKGNRSLCGDCMMQADEILLSICYILWHYRRDLLPEFHEVTKPARLVTDLADFLDENFPLNGNTWRLHSILLVPSELMFYIATAKEATDENLLRAPNELVRDEG